ncbi:DMT family transporter [Shimazuella sp. AN120528]|uniref:DMT family transporter n=1 Tax=Shimazuella soli TaxID=1892854 RepID=UPI001F0F8723|nr:DMT family transporter [Shimazuella soli]MCH5586518.1 DMT family transporter [Shimazuella soli]
MGTKTNKNTISYLLLIFTMIFWGSAFTGAKLVVGQVPPEVGAFLRFGFGAVFMFLLLLSRKTGRKDAASIGKKYWIPIILLGITGVALYNLCFFWGVQYSFASDGSSIVPTISPVVTTILAIFFLKNKLTKFQIIGLIICLIGAAIYFIGMNHHGNDASHRLLGNLFFLTCALCWGTYTILGNKVLTTLKPLPVTAYATLIGAIILGLLSLPKMVNIAWGQLGIDFWLLQIYLGFFCTALANWFYSLGVKHIGASKASTFMYFVPINGLWISMVFLQESLTTLQFIAIPTMLIGVWFVNKKTAKQNILPKQTIKIETTSIK